MRRIPSIEKWRETGVAPEIKKKSVEPRRYLEAYEAQLERARRRNARRLNAQAKSPAEVALKEARRNRPQGAKQCEICRERISGKNVCIDHCHVSLGVRGYLCVKCNAGLGMFRDSVSLLRHAITYLEKNGSWSTRDPAGAGLPSSPSLR